jgi:hypothetical protein
MSDEAGRTAGPLQWAYDARHDVITIEGVQYSGGLFREWGRNGMAIGTLFRLTQRDDDGAIQISTESDVDAQLAELRAQVDVLMAFAVSEVCMAHLDNADDDTDVCKYTDCNNAREALARARQEGT